MFFPLTTNDDLYLLTREMQNALKLRSWVMQLPYQVKTSKNVFT